MTLEGKLPDWEVVMRDGDRVRVTMVGRVRGVEDDPSGRFQIGDTILRNTIDPTAEHIQQVEVITEVVPARGTRFLIHRDDPEKGRNPAFLFYRSVSEEMREFTDLTRNMQYSLRELESEFEGYTWSHIRTEEM